MHVMYYVCMLCMFAWYVHMFCFVCMYGISARYALLVRCVRYLLLVSTISLCVCGVRNAMHVCYVCMIGYARLCYVSCACYVFCAGYVCYVCVCDMYAMNVGHTCVLCMDVMYECVVCM